MRKLKCRSHFYKFVGQLNVGLIPLLIGVFTITLYFLTSHQPEIEMISYLMNRSFNKSSVEAVDGYLVWSSKCRMLSKDPLDRSITKFVRREKFEKCSSTPLLTSISRKIDGTLYLIVNPEQAKQHKYLSCCWAAIVRHSDPIESLSEEDFDSKIKIGHCEVFEDQVALDKSVETLLVTCWNSKLSKQAKGKLKKGRPNCNVVYKNVHAVLNPERVRDRLNSVKTNRGANASAGRPLSVLMFGMDSVSRLNFHRSMPLTSQYLQEKRWIELRGYNKIGDNTFPNLMAILTGQNESVAQSRCKPQTPYGLDNCPFIWYNFKDAGYVTSFGEDYTSLSTFNYLKVGFVEPPTDYYLRPYVLAYEKLLKSRVRFDNKYCAGPELGFDRIFDYATEFAGAFLGQPSFGFFWSNCLSHDAAAVNGPSSVDRHFLGKLQLLERSGALDSSLVVLLSDHGMRFGDIRNSFVGWYEERLPFIFVRLPGWFAELEPEAHRALLLNQNRLTSPYDLYETLRDLVARAGGVAPPPSTGCPGCASLLTPAPEERGCSEAGIPRHWCTCNAFSPIDAHDRVVVEGANRFADHMEHIVRQYKSQRGWRLCARPRVKRIHRVSVMQDLENKARGDVLHLFYLIEITPGSGLFEVTIGYHGGDKYTIDDHEVSRINLYLHDARCLEHGYKQYCHCTV